MDDNKKAKHLLSGDSCDNCIYQKWRGKLITMRCLLEEIPDFREKEICDEYVHESIIYHPTFLSEVWSEKIITKKDLKKFRNIISRCR